MGTDKYSPAPGYISIGSLLNVFMFMFTHDALHSRSCSLADTCYCTAIHSSNALVFTRAIGSFLFNS